MNYYAITNFWKLKDKNEGAFDAIYKAMIGDAYTRKEIDEAEALSESGSYPDMIVFHRYESDYSYYPVITEQQTRDIEKRFGVTLARATVKARPDVRPGLYERKLRYY